MQLLVVLLLMTVPSLDETIIGVPTIEIPPKSHVGIAFQESNGDPRIVVKIGKNSITAVRLRIRADGRSYEINALASKDGKASYEVRERGHPPARYYFWSFRTGGSGNHR